MSSQDIQSQIDAKEKFLKELAKTLAEKNEELSKL